MLMAMKDPAFVYAAPGRQTRACDRIS